MGYIFLKHPVVGKVMIFMIVTKIYTETPMSNFVKNQCFNFDILFNIDIFPVAFGKFSRVNER